MRRRALAMAMSVAAVIGMGSLAPTAGASITPTASSSSAVPLQAGATGNLDLDLKFNPSAGDSPSALDINLPPGLLANASVDGGACLTGSPQINDPSPCQVGSGDVYASVPGVGGTGVFPTPVNFYLVPPPQPGDLAGLEVASGGTQVGTTGDIKIRPSGDPDGVGISIALQLPNNLAGVPLDISEIDSTFDGLRNPTTCPATPASVQVAANSYNDPTTKTASLPLPVGGCSSLPYSPTFKLTATEDKNDSGAAITTEVTQASNEAPNAGLTLALPSATLHPAITSLKALCKDPTSGKCTVVATATATSPDYPKPLTGQGYLTGSLSGLNLTLIFPSPFPLTLTGKVDLKNNQTIFTGLPDIPLTDLVVSLPGGSGALFSGACGAPSGTATATLSDQNGDKTVKVPDNFTIAGCGATGGNPSSGAGSSRPRVSTAAFAGLKKGHPSLRFTARAGKTKLKSLTVSLPKGLSYVRHKVGKKHKTLKVLGVSLKGAKLQSAKLAKGKLVITLRSPARTVTVSIGSKALRESKALRTQAQATSKQKRLKKLKVTVLAKDSKGKKTTIHVTVKRLGL